MFNLQDKIRVVIEFIILAAGEVILWQWLQDIRVAFVVLIVACFVWTQLHATTRKMFSEWSLYLLRREKRYVTLFLITTLGALLGGSLFGGAFMYATHRAPVQPENNDHPSPHEQLPNKQPAPDAATGSTVQTAQSERETQGAPNNHTRHHGGGSVVTPAPTAPTPPPATYSASNNPGSIINQGSTVGAPQTVNNYAPIARHLSDPVGFANVLKAKTGTVVVQYLPMGDDTQDLAQEILDAFKAAGWNFTQKQDFTVMVGSPKPWHGVQVSYNGATPQSLGGTIPIPARGTIAGNVVWGLVDYGKVGRIMLDPRPEVPTDAIEVAVGPPTQQ